MVNVRHYLDHNATTPLSTAARDAMAEAMAMVGNPSSVHAEGRTARSLVESARRSVAEAIGADPAQLTFTGSATEANNAIVAHAGRAGWRVLASAVEHTSVLEAEPRPERLPVTSDGVIDLAALETALAGDGRPALLCLMLANNETGVIQPVAEAAALMRNYGGWLHVDAVQAVGKLPFAIADLGADSLSLSAHKFGGPAGVGALVRRRGAAEIAARLRGGGQERRLRAGTENVIGIAGFAGAAKTVPARLAEMERISTLRDWLEAKMVSISYGARIFSKEAARLGNTTCIGAPGITAETAVIRFDLGGVAIGAGSACSSGKVAPSHVLEAMGHDRGTAGSAIRISLGPETSRADVEAAVRIWKDVATPRHTNWAAA